jgi:hypothetical protein
MKQLDAGIALCTGLAEGAAPTARSGLSLKQADHVAGDAV